MQDYIVENAGDSEAIVSSSGDGPVRERVLKLIDFLSDFDAIRNPPVYDINTYSLYRCEQEQVPDVSGVTVTQGAEHWLCVEFLELPNRPALPPELAGLLGAEGEISPHERPVLHTGDDDEVIDPSEQQLRARAEAWVATEWEPWSRQYLAVEASKKFYRDIFEVGDKQESERESLELVWGFGRLTWAVGNVKVNHPLITVPVEVRRDEKTQELTVDPAGPAELQTLCFSELDLQDREALNRQRDAISEVPPDPWSAQLSEDLRRAVRYLHLNGVVDGEAAQTTGAPVVDTGWVLYLRRRRPNYQGFLDAMRKIYQVEALPPAPLGSVVVESPSNLSQPFDGQVDGDSFGDVVGSDPTNGRCTEKLLLPLPANEEQVRILEFAQSRSGVTVQGPPGTGKSHTIANLVSHYVAYGYRALVVSEKEQALRVLADKIPPGIRDLAVSVLGADDESRKAMEGAITAIQGRVSGLDKAQFDHEIDRLSQELNALDAEIAVTTDHLLRTRQSEVGRLTGSWGFADNPTPQEAAKWVAKNKSTLALIPDAIGPGIAAPVSTADLTEMLRLVKTIGSERAEACGFELPNLAQLPEEAALAQNLVEVTELESALADAKSEIDDWIVVDAAASETIGALLGEVRAELLRRVESTDGWLAQLRTQLNDPVLCKQWQQFVDSTRAEREQLISLRGAIAAHEVSVPLDQTPAFTEHLKVAAQLLAEKGKLGLFAGAAKKAVAECQVDGRIPATADDVNVCITELRVQELRRGLQTRWRNQIESIGGPRLPDLLPENEIGPIVEQVADLIEEPQRWTKLRAELASLHIDVPSVADTATVERAATLLELANRRHTLTALRDERDVWKAYLEAGRLQPDASPLWSALLGAIEGGRTQAYREAYDMTADLVEIAPSALRLRQLTKQLAAAAPVFTQQVLAGELFDMDVTLFEAAWTWRQMETWIGQVASGKTPAALQDELETLAVVRRRRVAELVERLAWRRLADNLGDTQRQALNSYIQATKRYGKTGGKYAARWLEQIRSALNDSKDAIPVWIMTKDRALSSFRPEAVAPFDVLIVDEASQIGMEALPLLSLARKTIIVGDDKQTSPANVGLKQERVFNLLEDHLREIPYYKTLFDPSTSLYDLATQKFPDVVMLTEHFRCLPPIIEFSSQLSYNGRIEPLRDRPPSPGWKALGALKVVDGFRTGKTNEPEANAVVDLIERLTADPDYDGMDFGVVSLLGVEQGLLLRTKLFDRLGPVVMSERRIRVGEPANFQGDERDVVVVSTVVATDPMNPTARFGAMTSLAHQRSINVAASRAKQQMWVVHSIEPERLSDGDFRGELIRHCRNPELSKAIHTDLLERCDSEFERDVIRQILARGYRGVDVQYRVGAENRGYRIDIVVEGPETRLAVECDGDRWHGEERWHADRMRQEVLERAGWTFWRVRGSSYYRDPEAALSELWQRLDDLRIPTGDEWMQAASEQNSQVFEVRGTKTESAPGTAADEPAEEVVDPVHQPAEPAAAPAGQPAAPASGPTSEGRPEPDRHGRASEPAQAPRAAVDIGRPTEPKAANQDLGRPPPARKQRRTAEVGAETKRPDPHRSSTVSVPIPEGYRQVGWIRPYEAQAALDAYTNQKSCDAVNSQGVAAGRAVYHPTDSDVAQRFRANVELQRLRSSGPKTVVWLREKEARDILAADAMGEDIRHIGATNRESFLVQYFAPESPEATTYRSTTRLHRPKPKRRNRAK